jgi:hypothetical protein
MAPLILILNQNDCLTKMSSYDSPIFLFQIFIVMVIADFFLNFYGNGNC